MTNEELKSTSAADLQRLRESLETELQVRRETLRVVVAELHRRHRESQLIARYGKAAELLLKFISIDEITAQLSELIAAGKLQEQTDTVAVTENADIQLQASKPSI